HPQGQSMAALHKCSCRETIGPMHIIFGCMDTAEDRQLLNNILPNNYYAKDHGTFLSFVHN
ncbi:MAG: hypothetical protein JWM44_3314, partial [Bacilli bacterium]|nr:hypothetical protein [Bacilli bacterium]